MKERPVRPGRKAPPRTAARRPSSPRSTAAGASRPAAAPPDSLSAISHRFLYDANSGLPRIDYLARVTDTLLGFSGADLAALWLAEDAGMIRCSAAAGRPNSFRFTKARNGTPAVASPAGGLLQTLADDLAAKLFDNEGVPLPGLSGGGSFVADDLAQVEAALPAKRRPARSGAGAFRSLVLVKIFVGDEHVGVFGLASRKRGFFLPEAVQGYERLAPILGFALVSQRAQAAVHERVKELTCLYGIGQLSARPELDVDQIAEGVAHLLPPAWQYPEITEARIVLEKRDHVTPGFKAGAHTQSADVVVNQVRRGSVEVTYLQPRLEIDEGPFLKEERNLIDAVARQLALVIERRETAAERTRLQEQLRHADRLATIGQLAAGAAHELNEPLGNVLGFAQLAKKGGPAAAGDLDKIVAAALHAREIVKKLMLFARQTPPTKTKVNLNTVITEGLYLIEARCAKQGIELVRRLEPNLPDIIADPSQLHQVLVNLAVNAVQAMPGGGTLTIRTGRADGHVALIVEDTGCGMAEEVRRQIFIPFFTTKDVSEGTGLGLSVVHGIVSAHGGTITVASEPGRGARFEILLPLAGLATFKEADPDAVFW